MRDVVLMVTDSEVIMKEDGTQVSYGYHVMGKILVLIITYTIS